FSPTEARNPLRPEVIESIFYMHRLTHNPKYRIWAMQIAKNINAHLRLPTGFSGTANVNYLPTPLEDQQESFFLAETLKYLFLIFADDDFLPLDKFVINTEAHPLGV
ncbi:glycoside hydrolase, partial [Blyttiomyces helicus]